MQKSVITIRDLVSTRYGALLSPQTGAISRFPGASCRRRRTCPVLSYQHVSRPVQIRQATGDRNCGKNSLRNRD